MTGSGVEYRANPRFVPDNVSIKFGTGGDSRLYYDGTDLVISPADIGTGDLKVGGASLLLDPGERIDFGAGDVTMTHAASKLTFAGGDLHIGEGQGLVIGHAAQIAAAFGNTAELQVLGTGGADSKAAIGRWGADANGPGISFIKSRDTTIGSFAVVQDGDRLGELLFGGDDGADYQAVAARIRANVDGTPGTGDMPGRITFETTADGAQDTTERMRIDSAGVVYIGDIGNANMTLGLTINQGAADDQILTFKSSDISHPMTAIAEADTYGYIQKPSAVKGGLMIVGVSEDTQTTAVLMDALTGDPTPDETSDSTSDGIFTIRAWMSDGGTGVTAPLVNDNIFVVQAGTVARLALEAEGELHLTNATVAMLDDRPDALMARVGRAEMAPASSFLSDNFAGIVAGARSFLSDNKIMWDDPYGEAPWMNVQRSILLAWDMGFQSAQWIADIVNVLSDEQREKLPTKTREMLALMPAGS